MHHELFLSSGHSHPSRTRTLLWTLVCCIFADCALFIPDDGALSIPELIGLTLAAHADPSWVLPTALKVRVLKTALRLQMMDGSGALEKWRGWRKLETRDVHTLVHTLVEGDEAVVGVQNSAKLGARSVPQARWTIRSYCCPARK